MKRFSLVMFFCFVSTIFAMKAMADDNTDILKQGLLGAGVGAISSKASGGNAGKGALIGAGTNVIGGALLNTLMPSQPRQPQVQYVQMPPPQYAQTPYPGQPDSYPQQGYYPNQSPSQPSVANQTSSSNQPKKHIIRKYDADGNVVSEEEVWE